MATVEICSQTTGSVWSILARYGDQFAIGGVGRILKSNAVTDNSHTEPSHTHRQLLGEVGSKALMEKYGMRVPSGIILSSDNPEFEKINDLTPPLVAKILSPDIVHKSDGGFVVLGLETLDDVQGALEGMRQAAASLGAKVEGYLIEEMAPKGIEVVIGGLTDPSFGPMIMFGLGGVYVEVFRDVAFRICPIRRVDAEDMIDELICKPILQGARGGVAADRESLVDLLLRVGGAEGVMIGEQDRIEELDLNPIIIRGDSQIVVDARVVLKEACPDV